LSLVRVSICVSRGVFCINRGVLACDVDAIADLGVAGVGDVGGRRYIELIRARCVAPLVRIIAQRAEKVVCPHRTASQLPLGFVPKRARNACVCDARDGYIAPVGFRRAHSACVFWRNAVARG
jgi:hypothetical protein